VLALETGAVGWSAHASPINTGRASAVVRKFMEIVSFLKRWEKQYGRRLRRP
jgi:hypothetical protein